MSKNICEIFLKKCFVSLTAQKDQNIFVLVILKKKRHYLLDISEHENDDLTVCTSCKTSFNVLGYSHWGLG